MIRMQRMGLAWAATTSATLGVFVSTAIGAEVTIADLAPEGATIVVGVDDFSAMQAAFDRTGLRRIWDDPSVQAWFDETTEEATERLTEMLESIDARREDLSMPTGAAGFAVWLVEQESDTDPPFAFIAMGDFGEGAAKMHDTLVAAFEEGEAKDRLIVRRDGFADTQIFTLEQAEAEEADDDEAEEEDDWEEWEDWEDENAPTIEKVYYARAGSRLIASSTLTNLEDAIDRVGGKALASVRESEAFHAARAQVGANDVYAVLLTRPLYDMADAQAMAAQDEFGAGPAIMPVLDALGISDVRALSMGVKFDADDGMMETRYALLTPKMRGLLSLLDVPPTDFQPPAFVSADAATFTLFQFNLSDVMRVVQEIAQGLPAAQAQNIQMFLPMIQNMAGPMLEAMGSEIYVAQSYERPFSPQSQRTLTAIKAGNPEALSAAVGQNAASWGMVSRDFQGTQVWSMPADSQMGMMMPGMPKIAMAVGFGHMFIGQEEVVENALRQAGQGDALALSGEDRFQQAMRVAGKKGFSFSYTNLPRTLEYMSWYMDNFEQIMKAQMEQMMGDIDDPEIRELMAENQPEMPAWMKNLPDLDVVRENMGDSISEFHRTDDGLRGRTVWLRPSDED